MPIVWGPYTPYLRVQESPGMQVLQALMNFRAAPRPANKKNPKSLRLLLWGLLDLGSEATRPHKPNYH